MEYVIVERSFPHPVTFEDVQAREDQAAWCFQLHEVTFVNTWMSTDRRRMICVYRAKDAESVRVANQKASLPFDRVWSGTLHQPHAPHGNPPAP